MHLLCTSSRIFALSSMYHILRIAPRSTRPTVDRPNYFRPMGLSVAQVDFPLTNVIPFTNWAPSWPTIPCALDQSVLFRVTYLQALLSLANGLSDDYYRQYQIHSTWQPARRPPASSDWISSMANQSPRTGAYEYACDRKEKRAFAKLGNNMRQKTRSRQACRVNYLNLNYRRKPSRLCVPFSLRDGG